jgi:putative ABC transport system permease protein
VKFLPFVFKHLLSTWVRTASTVVSMALCVFTFCTLQSAVARLNRVVETRSPKRLIVKNAVSPIVVIPLSYAEQIRRVPGVVRAGSLGMFGGLLPAKKEVTGEGPGSGDWANAFANVAIDAEPYFAMNPELVVTPQQFRDFMGDLRGCVMGRALADRFNWKIGDRFFLESFAPIYRKASGPFEFVVRGFIDRHPDHPDAEVDLMLFHLKYLDEGVGGVPGTGMILVEIDDPARAGEISSAIDALFENASRQTLTETEKAATAEFMLMFGDLGALVNGIGLAVCFTILLVTANTMSMAVRERRTEIAVLKTLGFTGVQVMGLVVAEALLLGALGGGLGVMGAQALLSVVNRAAGQVQFGITDIELRAFTAWTGFLTALLLGLVSGLLPAWGAYRARVTAMLRTV